MLKTGTDPIAAPNKPTSANKNPTVCANCGGRESSVTTSPRSSGLTTRLKINAYGVNCGPRIAPIANTTAWNARARVLDSAQAHDSTQDLQALDAAIREQIKQQFDERDACLKAAESGLREREAFIEKSERTIFEKGQQLQEWEAELEQLNDELKT